MIVQPGDAKTVASPRVGTNGHALADVQGTEDRRGVVLDRVGVTGLEYPILVRQKAGGTQTVAARADITVGVDAAQRGAHLSSMIQALHESRDDLLGLDGLVGFAREVRRLQDQRGRPNSRADVKLRFTYFLEKGAPATGAVGLVPYGCGFEVILEAPPAVGFRGTTVRVPVATLCPCSLEISETGAHNQRAEVVIQTRQPLDEDRVIWLEDLVELAERSASAPVHSVLKRLDEKEMTETMFAAPRFTEDVVRDVVVGLRRDLPGTHYFVSCEAFESIHPHNAYAEASSLD